MPVLKRGDNSVEIPDLGELRDAWIWTADHRLDPSAVAYPIQFVSPAELLDCRARHKDNPILGVPSILAVCDRTKIELWPAVDKEYIFGAAYYPPMKRIE